MNSSASTLIATAAISTFQDFGLSDGTYYYVIIAINESGSSEISNMGIVVVYKSVPSTNSASTSSSNLEDTSIPNYKIPVILGISVIGVITVILVFRTRKIDIKF